MKISTVVICLVITVVAAEPVTAQQSLGDVAGSIKLKHPKGESVVIDRDTIAQSSRRPSGGTDTALLNDIIGACVSDATSLRDLIEETRDGTSFYRDPWRARVEEVGSRLDGSLEDLRMIAVDGRYQQAYDLAGHGADMVGDALVILRGAIAADRPVFSESKSLSFREFVATRRTPLLVASHWFVASSSVMLRNFMLLRKAGETIWTSACAFSSSRST